MLRDIVMNPLRSAAVVLIVFACVFGIRYSVGSVPSKMWILPPILCYLLVMLFSVGVLVVQIVDETKHYRKTGSLAELFVVLALLSFLSTLISALFV